MHLGRVPSWHVIGQSRGLARLMLRSHVMYGISSVLSCRAPLGEEGWAGGGCGDGRQHLLESDGKLYLEICQSPVLDLLRSESCHAAVRPLNFSVSRRRLPLVATSASVSDITS
ncbi:unnamed protein product [Pleuronectes platessa]|uniref:Uncharacterized protein n=1 Tax=Pleuronectes platessa TaxID=8262 RepID=A0A9N7U4P4_PLEPL|nr:unnamed protein product [Pleuronectes platessa]